MNGILLQRKNRKEERGRDSLLFAQVIIRKSAADSRENKRLSCWQYDI